MDAANSGNVALELEADPDAVAALRRRLGLGRARRFSLVWHDRDGVMAGRGIAVSTWQEGRAGGWRTEALVPGDAPWPIGAPPPLLGEATALTGLDVANGLGPVQRLEGQVRTGMAGAVSLRLVEGRIGAAPGLAVARLTVAGPAEAVAALVVPLMPGVRVPGVRVPGVRVPGVRVPVDCLAAMALALAGVAVPPRKLGAPILPAEAAPGAAFAHAAGHLACVLLHQAALAVAGERPEPVHQMRVALRRLRSLLGVFRDVVACPEVAALRPALAALAGALGPARDWDVFLAGTGRAVAGAFPDEPAVDALLAAAEARREAAYAALPALFAGVGLHGAALQVAILVQARPWPGESDVGIADFGAEVLARRWRRMSRRAGGIAKLPEAALHELRIEAKRLRYAAEVFAPLHPERPARRFLKRLAALQEALGLLNDGVVAGALMGELAGAGGAELAGGMVRGFVAARAAGARTAIRRAWKRLRRAGPFWI